MVLTLVYPVVNLLFQLIVDIEISNPPFIVSLPFFSFRILDVCHSRVLKAKNSLTPPLRWSTTILLWISILTPSPAPFETLWSVSDQTNRYNTSEDRSKQNSLSFILQRIKKEVKCITVSVIPLFYQTSAIWEILSPLFCFSH